MRISKETILSARTIQDVSYKEINYHLDTLFCAMKQYDSALSCLLSFAHLLQAARMYESYKSGNKNNVLPKMLNDCIA